MGNPLSRCKSRTWSSLPLPPPTPLPPQSPLWMIYSDCRQHWPWREVEKPWEPCQSHIHKHLTCSGEAESPTLCALCTGPYQPACYRQSRWVSLPSIPQGLELESCWAEGQSVPSCWQQGPESRIPGSISGGLFSADFPPLPSTLFLELCAVRDLLARSRLYFLQRHCSRHLLFYSTLECEEIWNG